MPYANESLRERRQASGVKAGDFATKVEISVKHLSGVEARRKPAAIEVFHRMAKELGVDVAALVDAETTRPEPSGPGREQKKVERTPPVRPSRTREPKKFIQDAA